MAPLMDYNESPSERLPAGRREFAIIPAKINDARRLVDIEFHAFETNQVNQILSYRDYKKVSHFERSVNLYESAMAEQRDPLPKIERKRADSKVGTQSVELGVSFSKVVDAYTQEIVSFAKVEMKRYTLEELLSPADAGHEGELKMNREWFALNERLRRQYVGLRDHCYIGMLATKPLHQHHGAGTLLLQKILQEADAAGVEVYLEATDTAKRLYERHGFETVTELRFDPAAYGVKGLGVERQTVMVRGARSSAPGGVSERCAVRSWDAAVAESRALLLAQRGAAPSA